MRFALARCILNSLGAARRKFLADLPDLLWLDEATVVAHGSPRHVRDTVTDKFVTTYKAGEPKPEIQVAANTNEAAGASK